MTRCASAGQLGYSPDLEQLPRMSGALPFVAHAPTIAWEMLRAQGNLGEALRRILLRHETLSLRVHLGPLPATLTADPELSRQLLLSNSQVCKKAGWERRVLGPVMEGGTIILEDDDWEEHRRAIAPTFGASSLGRLAGLVSRAARSRLPGWRGRVNVSHETRCILNEAISGYFLDGPLDERCPMSIDDLADRFARVEEGLEDHVMDRWGLSDRLQALFSRNLSFDRALADVTSFIRAVIESSGAAAVDAPASPLRTLLTRLPAGDSALKEIRTLIAAGMTTVHLLSWLLYLVAKHPRVQQRLRAAVDVDAPEDSLYVNAVINEGLRLYPPAPFLLRESAQGSSLHLPLGDAPAHQVLERSGDVSARALARAGTRWARAAAPAERVPSLRQRAARLHRQEVRADRGGDDVEGIADALPARRARRARPGAQGGRAHAAGKGHPRRDAAAFLAAQPGLHEPRAPADRATAGCLGARVVVGLPACEARAPSSRQDPSPALRRRKGASSSRCTLGAHGRVPHRRRVSGPPRPSSRCAVAPNPPRARGPHRPQGPCRTA